MIATALVLLAISLALYALHRFALALEARGYLYYRNKKGTGSSAAGVLMEVDRLSRPSVEHVIRAEDEQVVEQDHDGA